MITFFDSDKRAITVTLYENQTGLFGLPLFRLKSVHWFTFQINDKLIFIRIQNMDTDFASIPPSIHRFASPTSGWIARAALLHDYLYSLHGMLPNCVLTRKLCDECFYQVLIRSKTRWKAKAVYFAVRLFGGTAWSKKEKAAS